MYLRQTRMLGDVFLRDGADPADQGRDEARADGEKQEAIALSEGEMQRRVNEASGHAEEIRLVAQATADGIRTIADAIGNNVNGRDAVNLRLAEQYIKEFGNLAKKGNTMILPADLANVSGFVRAALEVLKTKESE